VVSLYFLQSLRNKQMFHFFLLLYFPADCLQDPFTLHLQLQVQAPLHFVHFFVGLALFPPPAIIGIEQLIHTVIFFLIYLYKIFTNNCFQIDGYIYTFVFVWFEVIHLMEP